MLLVRFGVEHNDFASAAAYSSLPVHLDRVGFGQAISARSAQSCPWRPSSLLGHSRPSPLGRQGCRYSHCLASLSITRSAASIASESPHVEGVTEKGVIDIEGLIWRRLGKSKVSARSLTRPTPELTSLMMKDCAMCRTKPGLSSGDSQRVRNQLCFDGPVMQQEVGAIVDASERNVLVVPSQTTSRA